MSNTYTQIYIQIVFAVKYRDALISPSWKDELYQYITGVVKNKGHKLLAIGGVKNHIHILISMNPQQSLTDLVRDIKRSSTLWIRQNKHLPFNFEWQTGYGAFSYNQSHLRDVIAYIERQEEHHRRKNVRDEYIEMLEAFQIKYDEKYIIEDV